MLDHAYSVCTNISSFSASVIRMADGGLESGDYKFIKSVCRSNSNEDYICRILEAVNMLKNEEQKNVIILRYFYNATFNEIRYGYYDPVDDVEYEPIWQVYKLRDNALAELIYLIDDVLVYEDENIRGENTKTVKESECKERIPVNYVAKNGTHGTIRLKDYEDFLNWSRRMKIFKDTELTEETVKNVKAVFGVKDAA
ncbi:hypothetical protein [Thomasclavelia ramosa]|nr:hypothetical protein [Thomasclavelia ramosa]MCI7396724.1 hypothetical protein [Thomasclavelia ramosa]